MAGRFTAAGNESVARLARFDGTRWTALGSGIHGWQPAADSSAVWALAWHKNALWVGGLFPTAGTKAAAGLARWIEDPQMRLQPPQRLEASDWRVPVAGVLGLRYRVESSPDLRYWTTVGHGAGKRDPGEVADTGPEAGARFYRARLEP